MFFALMWIVSCGKELIQNHNDIWSKTAMEMYAGLYRAVQSRRLRGQPPNRETSQTDAMGKDFGGSYKGVKSERS